MAKFEFKFKGQMWRQVINFVYKFLTKRKLGCVDDKMVKYMRGNKQSGEGKTNRFIEKGRK